MVTSLELHKFVKPDDDVQTGHMINVTFTNCSVSQPF